MATATAFTTGASYVTNLNSANTGQSYISDIRKQAVAFTTGANASGYTLSSVTLPLRNIDPVGVLTVKLYQMEGTGTYGTSSSPSSTALATLSGTDPTERTWADTTYTCSGSGCSLSASATYFVVLETNRAESFAWSVATTSTESTYPTNSGWDIGYGHNHDTGNNRPWFSHGNYHPVRVVFTQPTLSAGSIGATNAVLTIGNHTGSWHYQADTGPHTSCSSAQSGTTATLTGLTAGTTYTYKAYSDSGCTTANLVATAAAFTTLTPPSSPQSVSVGSDNFDGNIRRYPVSWNKPANTQATDSFGYQVECTSVNDRNTTDWTACGTINVASTSNTNVSQQVQHGWSDATFKYVRVRTEKNGLYSDWVIAKTSFGS